MNPDKKAKLRFQFLIRVVTREWRYLEETASRLFAEPFTVDRAEKLETDFRLAETLEAFVSRFGRLQDTLGDKFIPELLQATGEKLSVYIQNLDRAEKLGWIGSADTWLEIRQLRNQMVHEYIEETEILVSAINNAQRYLPELNGAQQSLVRQVTELGWSS